MDIDLDFGDRNQILQHIKHTSAAQCKNDKWQKHASGVYVTKIPSNPLTNWASIDYQEAEQRGYFKIDFLNVGVYQMIKDPAQLDELINTAPPWHRLNQRDFVEKIIHIGNHYALLNVMPQQITCIEHMAQFLAIIRPSKRHLAGKTWQEIAKTVWNRDEDGYIFRKSHSYAYAQLVMVHMNLVNQTT